MVRSKHQYSSGSPTGPVPAAVRIGSKSCLQYGETLPLPVLDRKIHNGWDTRCFTARPQPEDLPAFQYDIRDCHTQRHAAEILELMYSDADAAEAKFVEFYPGASTAVYPNLPNVPWPGSLIGLIEGHTIVVIPGTTNFLQWALQGMWGAIGIISQGRYSTLQLWNDAARRIVTRIDDAGGTDDGPIAFVGHSYGGTVASVLAAIYSVNTPNRLVSVLTFGSPKPGDSRLSIILDRLRQVHLVNRSDPVPYLPPNTREFSGVLGYAGVTLTSRWNQYERPTEQIGLNPDGSRTNNPSGEDLWGQVAWIILQAVLGYFPAALVEHNMFCYRERIICEPVPAPGPELGCTPFFYWDSRNIIGKTTGEEIEVWQDQIGNAFLAPYDDGYDLPTLTRFFAPYVPGVTITGFAPMKLAEPITLSGQWTIFIFCFEGGDTGDCGFVLNDGLDEVQFYMEAGKNYIRYQEGEIAVEWLIDPPGYFVSPLYFSRTDTEIIFGSNGASFFSYPMPPPTDQTIRAIAAAQATFPDPGQCELFTIALLPCAVDLDELAFWTEELYKPFLNQGIICEDGHSLLTEAGDNLITDGGI